MSLFQIYEDMVAAGSAVRIDRLEWRVHPPGESKKKCTMCKAGGKKVSLFENTVNTTLAFCKPCYVEVHEFRRD